ncbi:MAG: [acyl-carrier-protein] S-malonyltransferase [Deltaproteobacteria bacterium CG_4_9_14_3_um_filter_44_9]|nr:MAG: [acyl-carrier-protein] S-malonyltransferase [Deltaproteobacteria bacterium CG2_30_43_15]PIU84507.1 MAG: [acyl-carrier-protein] S-malonyltransferase [Deltaproteobacteria bacterium CG06_land_8_20_14_3_00_44_19]PIX23399.1 MAG: [acyl-carrier-protein] S-malonyltransferase [Deltaproteobacteria bacterium CG_4_8_14_3_um_filter_43_13]PJB43048.1 MAG: [acyl-carrier-protein] S-malonyltransferase [Deltaproteobacteria bacterium CG_4_9_14_3_um_filter_44_9]HCX89760.1 [acyl-carrier-protein] S-malonyltra
MVKSAFIFPGQGSQYIGMGKELYDNFTVARETFEEANDSLGMDIKKICFEDPNGEIGLTVNTQPAVLTASIAALRVLNQETDIQPSLVAGHSLGEYSSLVVAKSLSFSDAVKIVQQRGRFMQEAVPVGTGTMAAIIGIQEEVVEKICAEITKDGNLVSPANYNSPDQIVVSGESTAVQNAIDLAKERGARMAIVLNVSAPFHCSLMEPAMERLASELEKFSFKDIQTPVISNVEADINTSKERVKELLTKQVCSPVKWAQSMKRMIKEDVNMVIEVGPGKVLSGLMRKISDKVRIRNVEDIKSLKRVQED